MAAKSKATSFKSDAKVDLKLAKSFGLTEQEFERAKKDLGRTPTMPELGVFSVMWSEHCSYKSSRVHLSRLPTTGPTVVQGPGENAGAVDIGDGYCAVFKMESHNHPSYIEPYQGAATGVGGILRDVFTMGARPVASLNSLRFGSPNHRKTPQLLRGVVSGIGGYGNCIGVPTVGGELQFDESYDGNILVNAFTVGVAESAKLFSGKATGLGNPIIYVGAKTGRDGIHGATMASAEFDDQSEQKLPTVQVGDPFREKLLLEACLEIFSGDALEGIQDMGAAGLTSSSVEMAERGGTGVELDLDLIPRRTSKLSPYEMLLSESQERMLLVAKKGREQEVIDVCEKWDLDVAIVGRVTNTERFVCKATEGYDPLDGEKPKNEKSVVVDIPIAALTGSAPKYERPQQAVEPAKETPSVELPDVDDLESELLRLVGSPNIGSREWVYRQYDHVVRDGSVVRPGQGDAAVIRVFCGDEHEPKEKFLALSVDCNGRHVKLDPKVGAAMAVAECARNVVCSGGEPLGLTDCLNFGSPEKPETMWRFSQAVDGITEACLALKLPVVSGNVSFYNETDGNAILPTPTVAVVGKLQDPKDRLTMGFKRQADMVALLGKPGTGNLAGSEWLIRKTGKVEGVPLALDLAAEIKLQRAVLELAREHLLSSAHDVSDGGLGVALAECCVAGRTGCAVELPKSDLHPAAALFHEEPTRVVLSFPPENREKVQKHCDSLGVPFELLGFVGGDTLEIEEVMDVPMQVLADSHSRALESIVGED